MHLCKCFLCYFLAWEQLKAYVMLCYVKKTKSVVVYCVLTGLIQTHKSLRDGLILYGGHVQKHRRERQPETKSLCFPSKNVCHSNLEPAAQLYVQTEQVYSHNCT